MHYFAGDALVHVWSDLANHSDQNFLELGLIKDCE